MQLIPCADLASHTFTEFLSSTSFLAPRQNQRSVLFFSCTLLAFLAYPIAASRTSTLFRTEKAGVGILGFASLEKSFYFFPPLSTILPRTFYPCNLLRKFAGIVSFFCISPAPMKSWSTLLHTSFFIRWDDFRLPPETCRCNLSYCCLFCVEPWEPHLTVEPDPFDMLLNLTDEDFYINVCQWD